MADQKLNVILGVDSSKFNANLGKAQGRLKAFGSSLKGIGTTLSTTLTLPLAIAGGAAIKMASDFEESLNKVDVAFKDASNTVRDFAKTTLENFGIAEGTALDMAALFGDMSTSMGLSVTSAAELSTTLVGLAGDLASFKNMNIEEVTTALNGVFTGETESLKRLGIVMTQVNLQQFAQEQGIKKNIKAMTQAEKVNLRFQFVLKNTANAHGDFARTSEGAANQMRIFQESVKELGANFGQIILPAFTKMVKKANEMLTAFGNLTPETKKLVVVIAGIAAAIGPVVFILGSMATAFAFLTGPIGLALAALGGFLFFLDDIVNGFNDFIVTIKAGFKAFMSFINMLVELISLPFETISKLFTEFKANKFAGDFGKIIDGMFEEGKQISEKQGEETAKIYADAMKEKLENDVQNVLSNTLKNITKNIFSGGGAVASEQTKSSTKDLSGVFDTSGMTPMLLQGATGEEGNNLGEQMQNQATLYEQAIDRMTEKTRQLEEVGKIVGNEVGNAFNNMGQQMVDSLGLATSGFEGFLAGLASTVIKIISMMLANSVANAIAGATQSGVATGPAAVFTTPAFIATAVGGVLAAFAAIPKFANGGIVSGPTLGLMGEYSGAKSNPEVIAPLSKLQGMIGQKQTQNVNVGGNFRIQGQDLVLALQKADKQRNRIL